MKKIAIIGLGYVGLPLAVEFGKKYEVIGFDIKEARIAELMAGHDNTLETTSEELKAATGLKFSSNADDLADAHYYIVTVPTPVDDYKKPDLRPLIGASRLIGKYLKPTNIVIYESTVYPGCTEEDCVPILEEVSGLTYKKDFFCGYSPERINPGDKHHTLTKIKKVVGGCTPESADEVNALYSSIITAGTHKVTSIKVAEASKVIENAQRDLNIAFVNELALIFERMGVDTTEVLEAAGTKWNFLPFRPGLVGGHCIGVDPYYLTHKAESLGYLPQVILSGRRINDGMGAYLGQKVIKMMIKAGSNIKESKVLVLGITFKENCPDIRNSKVIDVIREISDFGAQVDVFDPWADKSEVKHEYGIHLLTEMPVQKYAAVVLAVQHKEFKDIDLAQVKDGKTIVYDVKSFFEKGVADARL